MKKPIMIISLVLILIFNVGASLDDYVKKPHAEKPLMFFLTHQIANIFAVNGAYAEFANIARNIGFRVDHARWTEINDTLLEGIDVLVMGTPEIFLFDKDKAALKRFIRGGGAVFLIGYRSGTFPWEDYANLSSFTREFGIEFGASTLSNLNGNVIAGVPLSGPEKVKKIRSPFARINLEVDESKAQIQAKLSNGYNLIAISTAKVLRKGKLMVLGDLVMMAKDSGNSYIDYEDNRNLAKNICHYFLGDTTNGGGGFDISALKSKLKGRNFMAGGSYTAIAKVKNIGKSASKKFKVRFVLSDDGTASPASTTAILKTVTVNEPMAPNKKKKISVEVKIPSWVIPGQYYLVVVVDPDNVSDDADESNNTKASKMFTVQ